MVTLNNITKVGIMISQTWPNSNKKEGKTLEVIEYAIKKDFFDAIQTVDIPFSSERKKISNLIKSNKLILTYCISRILNNGNFNLSDLDEYNRRRSSLEVIKRLNEANEAGAKKFAIISGPCPKDLKDRKIALQKLEDSLITICKAAASSYPEMEIIIEPMDISAHKKNSLGLTEEGIYLCSALRKKGLKLNLCLDTAHMLLNNEDPIISLRKSKKYVSEFHFCNCITDPKKNNFGDFHIPFGFPGDIGIKEVAEIMKEAYKIGFFNERQKPSIFCEIFKRDKDESFKIIEQIIRIFKESWKISQEQLGLKC